MKGLDADIHRVNTTANSNSSGPTSMSPIILGGMFCVLGVIFAAAALYFGRSIRLELVVLLELLQLNADSCLPHGNKDGLII